MRLLDEKLPAHQRRAMANPRLAAVRAAIFDLLLKLEVGGGAAEVARDAATLRVYFFLFALHYGKDRKFTARATAQGTTKIWRVR
jgi:hypothetical protein